MVEYKPTNICTRFLGTLSRKAKCAGTLCQVSGFVISNTTMIPCAVLTNELVTVLGRGMSEHVKEYVMEKHVLEPLLRRCVHDLSREWFSADKLIRDRMYVHLTLYSDQKQKLISLSNKLLEEVIVT